MYLARTLYENLGMQAWRHRDTHSLMDALVCMHEKKQINTSSVSNSIESSIIRQLLYYAIGLLCQIEWTGNKIQFLPWSFHTLKVLSASCQRNKTVIIMVLITTEPDWYWQVLQQKAK